MVELYNGINERHFGIRDWWQPKNLENGQFEKKSPNQNVQIYPELGKYNWNLGINWQMGIFFTMEKERLSFKMWSL